MFRVCELCLPINLIMQATKEAQDTAKALKELDKALSAFQTTSNAWTDTAQQLSSALRILGDTENLLATLQSDARALAVRTGRCCASEHETQQSQQGATANRSIADDEQVKEK